MRRHIPIISWAQGKEEVDGFIVGAIYDDWDPITVDMGIRDRSGLFSMEIAF